MELSDAMQVELQARKAAVSTAADDLQYQSQSITGVDDDAADARRWIMEAAAEFGHARIQLRDNVSGIGGARLFRAYARSAEQSCRFAEERLTDEVECAQTATVVIDQCRRLAVSIIEQVDAIEERLGGAEAVG